jgi:RNA polymerase-associated protein LEO1
MVDRGDRKLDDAELDSGDDEGRRDRLADTIEDDGDDNGEALQEKEVKIYPSDIGRMPEPEPGDGEVSSQMPLSKSRS